MYNPRVSLSEGFEERGHGPITDEAIQEMLALAVRLREQSGGDLDDSAIMAVAEATGAPTDYVRVALQATPTEGKKKLSERIKSSFLAFDPLVRRIVVSGVLGSLAGIVWALGSGLHDPSGFTSILGTIFAIGAGINCVYARDQKTAVLSGLAFPFISNLMSSVVMLVMAMFRHKVQGPGPELMLWQAAVGAGLGWLIFRLADANRAKLGLKDPSKERHELLKQLLDIQDKLRSAEKVVTFLSVDIVGSTRIKQNSDPLLVEYSFNEYHKFVEAVTVKFGGRVHSTAGDGVTCVFESPVQAYAAGRNLLAGLFEFNAYRNKVGTPMAIRAGLHTGSVLAPGQDATAVNFAHVIDVAAHLQKVCPPGALAVSEESAGHFLGGPTIVGDEVVETQGIRARLWVPKSKVELPVLD